MIYGSKLVYQIKHFGFWASGKRFAICAWQGLATGTFQATGDPFVTR